MASLKSYNKRKSKQKLVDLIEEAGTTIGLPRPYLGMSGLGNECMRALWFSFRWVKKGELSARTNRIFATGHSAEEFMVRALNSVGIKAWNILEDQDEFIDCYGYAKGHPDGYCNNVPSDEERVHLLEFKTMNEKSFKDVVKKGVKKSKPIYYSQMMLYMFKSELTRALFMCYNKNTSEFYIEFVDIDVGFAKDLIRKGDSILFSENYRDFERIGSNSMDWYECNWCNYSHICFDLEKVEETNCRTCNEMNLLGDGKFGCELDNDRLLSTEEQKEGCDRHNFMESLK